MLADGVGLPAQKLLADAKSESVKKRYQKNIREALEIDALGSPCYVLDERSVLGPGPHRVAGRRIDIRT